MRDSAVRREYLSKYRVPERQRALTAARQAALRERQRAELSETPCPVCDGRLTVLQAMDGAAACGRRCGQLLSLRNRPARPSKRQPRSEAGLERNWLRTYGLTLEQWAAYGAVACDLCGDPLRWSGYGRRLFHIDHDHAHCPAGKGCIDCVRGVLCLNCNTAEGGVQYLLARGVVVVGGRLASYCADPPFQRWRASSPTMGNRLGSVDRDAPFLARPQNETTGLA
jgi:hypothetical protein